MVYNQYVVMVEFDNVKNNQIKNIPPQCKSILKPLNFSDVFQPNNFFDSLIHSGIIHDNPDSNKAIIQRALKFGIDMGMLKKQKTGHHMSISFDDFCKIDVVNNWIDSLNLPNVKHLSGDKYSGTQGTYANKLHQFHSWLIDREFDFTLLHMIKDSTFVETRQKISLKGIDHLLELF